MTTTKRVAVIGAGTSGLMAIKCLKEEGFEPVCFEKTDHFGGLWHFREESLEGTPSCMWSTSLNNSKEPGAISDFPAEPEYPNYMRHFKVLQMFSKYAEKFDLLRHIVYKTEVLQVRKAVDYNMTGRWKILVRDTGTGGERWDVFDGVMVCVGHLSLPNKPEFPGMEEFGGRIVHTHRIKKFLEFADQTVVVVGTGSSALDAAVEISHVANQVYWSVRTPAWIATRMGPYGYPMDWTLFNRDVSMLQDYVPLSWCNKFVQSIYINPRFSHDLYNIHPETGIASRDPAVNDEIASRLMNGSVILKKDIETLTQNGVLFCEEDRAITGVDTVVMATGYKWEFPFLDKDTFVTKGNKIHLYKCVFPPQLKQATLGIVGFVVPLGPGFPVVEMQCRWFAQVLKKNVALPSREVMMKDIDAQYNANLKRFADTDRLFIHIDFVPYLDDLASQIGVKPNFLKMALTDFRFFYTCFFGVFAPSQYRLQGPHKWSGARQAILEAGTRMRAPLQGKKAVQKEVVTEKKASSKRNIFITTVVVAAYLLKKGLVNYKFIIRFIQMFFKYVKSLKIVEDLQRKIMLPRNA